MDDILTQSFIGGVFLLIVAGSLCGMWAAPTKRMRSYGFEHWLFILALVGLLVLPWLGTVLLCPHLWSALSEVPAATILKSNMCFMAWGLANVLFGHCLARIGFSLTFGVMTGIGLPLGVVIPMVIKGSGKFSGAPDPGSPAGISVLLGVAIMLLSVCFTASAGYRRERHSARPQGAGFMLGLAMAVLIGILQIGMLFAFVYSQGPITEALLRHGARSSGASIGVWAVSLPGGVMVNLAYAAVVMTRHRSWGTIAGSSRDCGLALLASVGLFMGIALMGIGMRLLGPLGASVGFGLVQAFQIVSSQLVGVISGEWKDAHASATVSMTVSVGLMLIAVLVMASARWNL